MFYNQFIKLIIFETFVWPKATSFAYVDIAFQFTLLPHCSFFFGTNNVVILKSRVKNLRILQTDYIQLMIKHITLILLQQNYFKKG